MKRSLMPLAITMLVLAFFYVPLAVMTVYSFNNSRFGGAWQGATTKYYAEFYHELADPEKRERSDLWNALKNTLLVAAAATAASTLLGTTAALALHMYRSKLQFIHHSLVYTPLVIPEILMGMSLLLFFVALGVSLSMTTIVVAHVTFCVSYVAMTVLGRLQDFDFTLMDAARDLGANTWQAVWRVLLPLLFPGILAGALLAFTLSLDDLVVTSFVSGSGSSTLPLYIYSAMKHGSKIPKINALSVMLLAFTFLAVAISQRLASARK